MCHLCNNYKPSLSERIGQAVDYAFSALVAALLGFMAIASLAALYGASL